MMVLVNKYSLFFPSEFVTEYYLYQKMSTHKGSKNVLQHSKHCLSFLYMLQLFCLEYLCLLTLKFEIKADM